MFSFPYFFLMYLYSRTNLSSISYYHFMITYSLMLLFTAFPHPYSFSPILVSLLLFLYPSFLHPLSPTPSAFPVILSHGTHTSTLPNHAFSLKEQHLRTAKLCPSLAAFYMFKSPFNIRWFLVNTTNWDGEEGQSLVCVELTFWTNSKQ